MGNIVYKNKAGAGEYTRRELSLLSILRYVGMIFIGAGIYFAIFTSFSPIIWVLLLFIGISSSVATVSIMKRGLARYRANEQIRKKQKGKKGKR